MARGRRHPAAVRGRGGSITGEHGIGEEKKHFMPVMFSAADLDAMQRLRDAFDPHHLCNPTKMFPGTDASLQKPVAYEPHPIERRAWPKGISERAGGTPKAASLGVACLVRGPWE